jgi:diacylglycerol kinase family enzyme
MLSISVAVYNLPEITRRCFESLERTIEGLPFEVLVYDNHSTDPAMQALYATLDPSRYKIIRAGTNIGYRGAHRENAKRFLGEWFVNSVGFGFGPAVVQTRNRMVNPRGFFSYLVPIVRTFFTFQPQVFDVAAPGFRERGYMMMIEACNGTTAGGSYRFAPDADPADGKMDVCLIRRVSLPRFLMAIPRVIRGTHTSMREVAMIKTAKLVVRSPEQPLVVHVDGELREPGTNECTVELERGRLNVLVAR